MACPDAALTLPLLCRYTERYASVFDPGMRIDLPDVDRRQRDMALSSLQSSFSNFVGNQSNCMSGERASPSRYQSFVPFVPFVPAVYLTKG